MKKLLFTLLICAFSLSVAAQDTKKETETIKTKIDEFSSKTGSITKFVDTKLPNLSTAYASLKTRIRKISNTNISAFFYQIEKENKYGSVTASIEYSDLVEIIKALSVLKTEVEKDIASDPDYMENKFTTVDGFQIGYYVSKGKATWYIRLDKYSSENTVFINDVELVDTAFNSAKTKIEELKK